MQKKILTTFALLITVGAVVFFVQILFRAMWYVPASELEVPDAREISNASPRASAPLSGDYPVLVHIPSLHIEAEVERVGVNWRGNMASPASYNDVGWYKHGTVPGDIGSAVLNGHLDNGLGLDGAFKHLEDISVGDVVFVSMKSGARLHFVVVEKHSYPYMEVPTEELFSRADASRLNLVTCDGRWVRGGDTYDHRLVVYTQLSII